MHLVKKVFNKNKMCFVHDKTKWLYSRAPRVCSRMSSTTSTKDEDGFGDVWPGLVQSIVQGSKVSHIPAVANWIEKVLDYNTNGGKKIRGRTTVYTYEILEKPENITEESMKLARILGWCVEMLQAHLITLDDIIDGSKTRRGAPCWYTVPEVGLGAINDGVFLIVAMHLALKMYFNEHPSYQLMVDHFNRTLLYTGIGQYLDFSTAYNNKDFANYTIERYEDIIKYKAAYYTFQLPVALGLLLANITDRTIHEQVDGICLQFGRLFQMQDDYLDTFVDETVTGKQATDIREGKCTWFAVQALHHCNEPQKKVFKACYGSTQPAHIERIQNLYLQLGLKELFHRQEKEIYDHIKKQSEELELSTGIPAKLMMRLLRMLEERRQ